jgi:hypothetical protein
MGLMIQADRVEGDAPSALPQLQLRLLRSVLAGAPLPGGVEVRFPDQQFLARGSEYLVLAGHLGGALPAEGFPQPLRVVSEAEVLERARTAGEAVALLFRKPEMRDDEVLLVLEGVIFRADGTRAPLSSVQVRFTRRDGSWTAEPPTHLAG